MGQREARSVKVRANITRIQTRAATAARRMKFFARRSSMNRTAIRAAWTAVIAAEFLGAQTGLGQIIVFAQYFGYVGRMFLVALFLLFYAAITYALFERASRRLTEWMPRELATPDRYGAP